MRGIDEKEALEKYAQHCNYWAKKLSIGNYFFFFCVTEFDEKNHPASTEINSDELSVMVYLSDVGEIYGTIQEYARHEMLEVLVDSLADGLYHTYSDDHIQKLRHDVIHRLEKILPLPSDKEVGYVGKKKKKKVKKGLEPVPCGKKKKPKGK